jgi:uncharacterized protein (DUF983 family)
MMITSGAAGGTQGPPIIVILLIGFIVIVLTHAVESILIGHLHNQLITGLDHSLQVGLLQL